LKTVNLLLPLFIPDKPSLPVVVKMVTTTGQGITAKSRNDKGFRFIGVKKRGFFFCR
jgi:hypothetical protein